MDLINTQESSVQPEPTRSRISVALSKVKQNLFRWYVLKTLLMGQLLSLFICGTAVTSQYLAERYRVDTPMLQSFLNYCLLFMVYTVWLAFRPGENGLLYIVRHKWWKYLLLGIVDVEANYSIVKAYQYTTLTSVQLLDCVGIPVLMALSWFILHSRYKLIHYIAVVVCLLGVGTMVGADVLSGRESGKASDMLIGDALVILAACLYAVSNVTEEYVVKNLTREEFLGMLGLFGTFISGIQLMILEYNAVINIQWNWQIGLLFAGFALCMFGLYSVMPLVMKVSSATSVNLGILTADIYSLFFGLFLFGYAFSVLYILAFVVCIVGFIMYCSTSSYSAEPPSGRTNEGIENGGMKQEGSPESETPLHHIPEDLSIDRQD
ncbi:PREDICTED: solute carrier family 35 member F2-like [Nanorana parkeri]|uniref:solute carrier family 35 member F2-like n=1 Tax=Nanorana parkeri TaxID=125878 RepID=UPI000854D844|nr:PREDICTED: solute carrier family 35 member F2-like [Nanorana parkeri]